MQQDTNTLRAVDPFVSFEEKKTNRYGLQVARFISGQWFGGGVIAANTNCEFMTRRESIINKRKFVRGEKDINQFKKLLANKESLKYLNIDFRYINIARKFTNIVINGMSPENYSLDIRSTDKLTVKLKNSKMDEYRKYMASQNLMKGAKSELGIDLMPNSFVPENEEELELYMAIKDRPKIEIAEELLIDWILKTNNFNQIDADLRADLVNCGIMIVRVYTDKNDGVKVAYVDPQNYVHSYVNKNDFSDKFYEGVVETITVGDLIRESGIPAKEAEKIAVNSYGFIRNTDPSSTLNYDKLLGHKIDVLRFSWKTVKTLKYKQKLRNGEVVKVSKRKDDFEAKDVSDFSEISKTFDTWFEGSYVIGSDYLYDWRECENMYDDVMNKAMSPFQTQALDIYNNKLYAFTDEIEVIADGMQLTALKIKHLLSELKPDIITIDIDLLAELPTKGGTKREAWEEALSLFEAKGIALKKRVNLGEDGVKEGNVVDAHPFQQGQAIAILLNSWANDYNLIRENTGINPAVDGSLPSDALVGVSEMNRLASNRATKDIVDTWIRFRTKVSELISTRIQSISNYKEAKHIKALYENVISKHFVDAISVMENRHLHEFGFTFNIVPAVEAIQEFREDLNTVLQEGTISVEEKAEALNIFKVNPKLAKQYLAYRRKKEIERKSFEQERILQVKSQNDAMAAQAKTQADTEAYQYKKQIDLQFASEMAQIEVMKQQALNEVNKPKDDEKFQQEVYLAQIALKGKESLESYKEDRKDDRTKKQATQQSKMIEQRHNNTQPIDFEDNWLDDDFDF